MKNEELSDLILSIKLEVKDDFNRGVKTTRYKLPEAALTDNVIEALHANFEHYESCSVDDGLLVLVHPKLDE